MQYTQEIKILPDSANNECKNTPLVIPRNKLNLHILDVRTQWRGLTVDVRDCMLSIFLMIPKNKLTKQIKDSDLDVNSEHDCITIKTNHKRLRDLLRLKISAFHYQGGVSRSKISEVLFIPYSTVSLVIRRFKDNSVSLKHWFNSSEAKISRRKSISN